MNWHFPLSRLAVCMLLAAGPGTASAEPPDLELAKAHLTLILHSSFGDDIVRRLENSGLDPAEIDSIAFKAMQGYAACTVEHFARSDDAQSRTLISWLAQGKSKEEIDEELKAMSSDPDPLQFMDAMELQIRTCTYSVDQELGLPASR